MNKSLHNLHSWLINNHFHKEALFISNLNKYASLNQRQLTIFIKTTFPDLPNTDEISNRLYNLFKGLRDVDSFNQMISSLSQEQLEPFVSKLEQVYPQVKSKLDKILPQNLAEIQAKFYIVKFYKNIDTPSFLSNLDDLQSKEDFFNLMKGTKKEKQISSIFEGKNIEGLSQLELQWIEKVYNDPNEAHSVDDILSLVRSFKRDQERFDKKVTDFESYAEVTKYLDSKSGISEHAYMESIRIPAQSNNISKVVYEDDEWKVVAIGSSIAAQYWRYAANAVSSMCIGRLEDNLFYKYGIKNNLDIYFIIDKVDSGTDNPMRMFSIPIARSYSGNPILSNEPNTRVNALNQEISIDDIKNKLGNSFNDIDDAIMQDARSRKESLGRENYKKLNDLIKDRESTLNNIKHVKMYINEFISDEKNIKNILRYNIDNINRLIAERLINDYRFFLYRLNEMYPDLERAIAEKWANNGIYPAFSHYKLNEKYPDLERLMAEKWANDDEWYFFYYKFNDKYPDLERVIAEKWANDGSMRFFDYKLNDKYPDLERVIAEKLSNDNDLFFFGYRLNEKYPDLERVIAEKLATKDSILFFDYGLNEKYPDLVF
jgi:hypothetical protein